MSGFFVPHDLKAPLRAIGHLAEWIEQDVKAVASPETCENISLLQSRVIRMQNLLDGLLGYSHVGRTTSAVEDVDVARLTSDVASMLGLPSAFVIRSPMDSWSVSQRPSSPENSSRTASSRMTNSRSLNPVRSM